MFFDPAMFGFVGPLVANWQAFRDELRNLNAPVLDLHRVGPVEAHVETLMKTNGWTPSWQVDSTRPNADWLTYGLGYKGMLPDRQAEILPMISGMLPHLRGFEVAAFSKLAAGAFIRPHAHPELAGRLLTLHIGIDLAPGRSYICVDGEAREEQNGRAIIFSGAAEHFAVNMSDTDRVILYLEFDPRETRFCDRRT